MKDIIIELASPKDHNWASKLMAHSEPWIKLGVSQEKCNRTCHDPAYEVYVARRDNKPIAFMILDRRGLAGAPYIKSICVHEKFRNQQVGESMIHFAENLFLPMSKHLFLCVSSFNSKASSFYHRIGFRQVGELPDFVIDGASEYLMYKRIS